MQDFTDLHFRKFNNFIYDKLGICVGEEKKQVLHTKLSRLMAKNNISSYDEYYNILSQNREKHYIIEFNEVITVNKTDFFREINHFNYIKQKIHLIFEQNPRILKNKEIRVWSSACSTGQEPYTIAMILSECLPPEIAIKILATDISKRVIEVAQMGVYNQNIINEVQPLYLQKYFKKHNDSFSVNDSIKNLITFRLFNLMCSFPFKNTFDIVFCRNVMIYFDAVVQQQVVNKFYNVMAPRGLLLIGHSESLAGKEHRFEYIQPTIYIK